MSTLSACLIVRDEEQHLEACLRSLRPFVDQICVVDTGSTDGTVALAEAGADVVGHFEWCGDFSAARNHCLGLASGDWILAIDADEVLDEASGPALRAAIESTAGSSTGSPAGSLPGPQAWFVTVESRRERGAPQRTLLPRLFRNRPEIRFQRCVHESVMDSLVELGVTSVADSGVRLIHAGYRGEAVAKKRVRNLMLLRKRSMEAPGDLYNTFKLAATLRDSEQAAEQLATFEIAHRQAEELGAEERATYPFLPLVYDGFAACLVRHGRLALARRVLDRGLELFADCAELLWRRGELARGLGDAATARRCFEQCLRAGEGVPLYAGSAAVRGAAPHVGLALVAAEAGDVEASLAHVGRALARDPDDLAARSLDVRLRLAGDDAEAGLRALEELMSAEPEAELVRLLAGEVALARGDRETAADLWRAAALMGTGSGARCRLAVLELGDGQHEGAAEHLAKLADRDLETAACRAVLAVVAGVPLELDEALDRGLLLQHMVPWLRELLAAPDPGAVQLFASSARLYAEDLPGVESLLVPAEGELAPEPAV